MIADKQLKQVYTVSYVLITYDLLVFEQIWECKFDFYLHKDNLMRKVTNNWKEFIIINIIYSEYNETHIILIIYLIREVEWEAHK